MFQNDKIDRQYVEMIQKMDILNSTPEVLIKAIQAIEDPNTSIEELADIIRRDIGLSAEIIRMSNSSYYSYSTPSSSVMESLKRIGFKETSRLLSIKFSNDLFSEDLTHYNIPAEIFWENSISQAVLMEELAQHCDFPHSDAYLAGLLSNIGTPVIDNLLTKNEIQISWDKYEPVHIWEEKHLGFNHCTAAYILLEAWNFPSTILEAIYYQYAPHQTSNENTLALALSLTNQITELASSDLSIPITNWSLLESICTSLNLNKSSLEEVIAHSQEQIKGLSESFFDQ